VVLFSRSKRLKWPAAALFGAVCAALLAAGPRPASAGIFDFLFGPQQQAAAPPDVTSYAEPPAPLARLPTDLGTVRPGSGSGRFVAFCVRLCDGEHFPLDHMPNARPVETCRAMCPASKTKVYFGSDIDRAVARDGARYADLDNAFVYRQRLVPHCTCNGKDAFGLAKFDLTSDPTLRPGDIVATKSGFMAYSGKPGQPGAFTPVDRAAINAELNGGFSRVQVARRSTEPRFADEARSVMLEPQADVPAGGRAQAAR
jgi:hypothetical protein